MSSIRFILRPDQTLPISHLLNNLPILGNTCGRANSLVTNSSNSGLNLGNRAKLAYIQIGSTTISLCVPSCPNVTVLDCSLSTSTCQALGVCLSSLDGTYNNIQQGYSDSGCPTTPVLASADTFGLHRCIPTNSSYVDQFYREVNQDDIMQKVVHDFAVAGLTILWCALIAMAISFIVIILMRCCAGIIIWTLVFSGVLALVACTVFLFVEWSKWKVRDQTLTSTKDTTKLFEALMIISLILTLILLILVIALRNRIRLCVAVFKEASRATARMPQIVLTPFLGYIFMAGLFVYWIWVYL